MSSSQKCYEHIFNDLKEYMFLNENIMRYSSITSQKKHKIIKPKKIEKIENIKNIENIIYPHQKDNLFWCFFLAFKGFDTYELNHEGSFKKEKDFKIASIEKLREKTDILKQLKIKRNQVEDELLNKPNISIVGLCVLCIIYNISAIYVCGKKYYEFNYGNEISCIIITDNSQKKIGVKNKISETEINNIREKYWCIDNILKPLFAINKYSIKELQNICEKLELPLINENGKKINKKILYENIIKNL